MTLQTEFEFTLPRGYVDSEGNLHKDGVMKLAVEGYKMVYVIPRHPFPPLNNLNETFGSFLGVAPADFFRSHGIQDNAQLDDFL